jgi:hypothetical protein
LLIGCAYVPLKAQINLVPNPSFEDVIFCPNGTGQLYLANGWSSFGNSPDLFCTCSPIGLNVPNNYVSYQFANTGECMGGFLNYRDPNGPTGPNTREFLGTELIHPVTIGVKYYFSCRINFAYSIVSNIASNNFGLKLLTYAADSSQPLSLLSSSTLFFTDSIVTDTLTWHEINGSFIADSSYTHLALGNFLFDTLTDTLQYVSSNPYNSYYFVDDVCLSDDSLYCKLWTHTPNEIKSDSKNTIIPNPANTDVEITNSNFIKSISIYDCSGKQLSSLPNINQYTYSLSVLNLTKGFYFIKIETNQHIICEKLIKL